MGKKLIYEQVCKYFEDNNCELLEIKYKNARTKMKYKCSCGGVSEITFDNFKNGTRCFKCSGSIKYTYEYVYKYFKDNNCELLEKEYKNIKTAMKYKCKCGSISQISFTSFRRGTRCQRCGRQKTSSTQKKSFEYIYNYFKEQKCELLEKEYVNAHTVMGYKCECGNIGKISFKHFKNGHRCKLCGIIKISGKNSYNYNSNLTDEERSDRQKTRKPEYRQWRKEVYKKDKFTCQRCSQSMGNLNAHHVANWADNKDLRYDVLNGLTFCVDCHKEFHQKYGKRHNNQQQINDFLTNSNNVTSTWYSIIYGV